MVRTACDCGFKCGFERLACMFDYFVRGCERRQLWFDEVAKWGLHNSRKEIASTP